MATYRTPQAAAATAALVGATAFGAPAVIVGALAMPLAANMAVNDIFEMVRVPPGGRVFDTIGHFPDLDTNGAPTITVEVGYGGDTDYFVVANTVAQAGGIVRAGATAAAAFSLGGPLILSATDEDTVDIRVSAGPATAVNTGTIYLTVEYNPPGSF